jgi:hypothetical protein
MKRVGTLLARAVIAALLVLAMHASVASADPGTHPAPTANTLTQPEDPGFAPDSQPQDPGFPE